LTDPAEAFPASSVAVGGPFPGCLSICADLGAPPCNASSSCICCSFFFGWYFSRTTGSDGDTGTPARDAAGASGSGNSTPASAAQCRTVDAICGTG
jgi:hypothetical protein